MVTLPKTPWLRKAAGGCFHYGVGPVSLGLFVGGLVWANLFLLGGGAVGLCLAAARLGRAKPAEQRPYVREETPRSPVELDESDDDASSVLVRQMLTQDRYALLVRPGIVENLNEAQIDVTLERMEAALSLVPAGAVVLGDYDELSDDGRLNDRDIALSHARLVEVEPVFLDRFPVTNSQYYQFLVDGGYEQMAIWDEEIWPAVLDFVDRTGHPGPKFWERGRYTPGEERRPVVGVSWYEACAYARWAGKRLAKDAEWVKAGCWPVNPAPGTWIQRRFPWGNASGLERANVWGTGPGHPEAIDAYPYGASVGGIHQLVGNVWEWTLTNFGHADDPSLTLPYPMKSIRGGAFDTYFENQATCHFQSGENPLSRKHNIGFRLALSLSDLAPQVVQRMFPADEVLPTDDAPNEEALV